MQIIQDILVLLTNGLLLTKSPQRIRPDNFFCLWLRLSQFLCNIVSIRMISILLMAVIGAAYNAGLNKGKVRHALARGDIYAPA
ncbi:hypothetical protein T296_11945 [Pantoea agglomerans Eh318]|nr:hypothetical protein T296_11945 [Pantoea agglomerans Eh318]